MNKTNLIKSATAVVLLSFGIAGASMAEPSANRENQRSNQSERYSSEITYSAGTTADRALADRHNIAGNNRSHDSYSQNQHGIQISIYQRDRYGSQSRGGNILRNMSAGERQAVHFFQNHPNERRFVKVDNRHRRYVYNRSDYPKWLLRS